MIVFPAVQFTGFMSHLFIGCDNRHRLSATFGRTSDLEVQSCVNLSSLSHALTPEMLVSGLQNTVKLRATGNSGR